MLSCDGWLVGVRGGLPVVCRPVVEGNGLLAVQFCAWFHTRGQIEKFVKTNFFAIDFFPTEPNSRFGCR